MMRSAICLGLLTLLVASCTAPSLAPAPLDRTPTGTATASPSDQLSEEPLSRELPPAGAASEFSTDFGMHSVPYDEIVSGGPGKDGIPAVDEPAFVGVEEADKWLEPQEAVVVVQAGEHARAYPVQILMWHEIVNDALGGVPVTVTFCPLCNTAIAFERTVDGQVLSFGTTGRLRYGNLIMYDRQTETWWQQASGKGIAGELVGRQLEWVPAQMISWRDFRGTHPDGTVLSRETGYSMPYGQNPYPGYDNRNQPPSLYAGPPTPGELPAVARVLGVDISGEAVAYRLDVLEAVRVANDTVGTAPIAVMWASGMVSPLDSGTVDGGGEVGAATVFSRELDGETLTFVRDGDLIVDDQTGSEWDLSGRAVQGPFQGAQLTAVVGTTHFWSPGRHSTPRRESMPCRRR